MKTKHLRAGSETVCGLDAGSWAPLSCSNSDTYSTGFAATNPAGQPVSGVVCCGVLKSCTVRF